VTWLPNQLQAVMDAMVEVWEKHGKDLARCGDMMEALLIQRETLRKEVETYCKERNVDLDANGVQLK